jgi:CRISPR-associated protein Cmr1
LASPEKVESLQDALCEFVPSSAPNKVPEYTAFCCQSRVVIANRQASAPLELLDLVGREMIRFRSWGHDGKIFGNVNSEKLFQRDHDLMKSAKRDRHPERIVFGLPHNYGKRDEDKVEPAGESDRRASPLFIHLHECDQKAVAVLAFLPSVFLPQGTGIDVGGRKIKIASDGLLWKPIHDFLNRFAERKYKESFTDAFEVRP